MVVCVTISAFAPVPGRSVVHHLARPRYEIEPGKTEVFFSGSRRAGLLEQDMKRLVEPGLFDIMVGRNPVSLEACPGGCQLGSSIGTHIRAGLCSQSSKL